MFRKNIIYSVVILIGAILLTDILLTRHYNKIIRNNKDVQGQAELIKQYHDQIGKVIIHSLDIGERICNRAGGAVCHPHGSCEHVE